MGKREEAIAGKIKVLKKNKETIPQEELHGKYADAYRRLQDSIKDDIRGFILEELAGIKADPGSAAIIFHALEKAYVEGGYSNRAGGIQRHEHGKNTADRSRSKVCLYGFLKTSRR